MTLSELTLDNKDHVDYGTTFFDRTNQVASKRNLTHSYSMSDASTKELSMHVNVGNDTITLMGSKPELLKVGKEICFVDGSMKKFHVTSYLINFLMLKTELVS